MVNEIIPYLEMCSREGVSLQRGMNFGLGGNHSVILMSVRAGAPYDDRLEYDGTTLIYEGHDEPKTRGGPDPKSIDQVIVSPGKAGGFSCEPLKAACRNVAATRPLEPPSGWLLWLQSKLFGARRRPLRRPARI